MVVSKSVPSETFWNQLCFLWYNLMRHYGKTFYSAVVLTLILRKSKKESHPNMFISHKHYVPHWRHLKHINLHEPMPGSTAYYTLSLILGMWHPPFHGTLIKSFDSNIPITRSSAD